MHRRNSFNADWWQGRFRGCGYKITASREVILDMLSGTTSHVSAEDIFFKVRSMYPGIGLTTVYRILEILVRMELVYRFDFGEGRARYEFAEREKGKDHHHLIQFYGICERCNVKK